MLQANFSVTPQIGDVLATKFTIVNLTSGASVEQYVWDFGTDNLIYDVEAPIKTYNYPGAYTITLSAKDYNGNVSTYSQQITADLVYRDFIRFTQIPELFSDPGKETERPFKFQVISSNPDKPIIVDLFATNSHSVPYEHTTKRWNFLTPTWKFLDKNRNTVTHLNIQPEPIYKENTIVAVSGIGEFYYVDSLSTGDPNDNCPILITATLQTSGFNYPRETQLYPYESYANNLTVRAGLIWQINDLQPTFLKVTSNYIEGIDTTQWENIKIPILITPHSNRSHLVPGSKNTASEILFSYPSSNLVGSQVPVSVNFTNLNNNNYTIDEAPLFFQKNNLNSLDTSGYIFTTVTGLTSISATSIVAQTTASLEYLPTNNAFPYFGGFAPNVGVWVSNPEKNTLNKITIIPDSGQCNTINHFKKLGLLTDGQIENVQVPSLTTTTTFNYEMSGFSGIYGLAIDPRNYELLAADAELDRLYKFSNTGELIKTLELSSLDAYSKQEKKMFQSWTWKTTIPETTLLSNDAKLKFTFYGDAKLSPNINNYILQAGGLILPTNPNSTRTTFEFFFDFFEPYPRSIQIDPQERTFVVRASSLNLQNFAEDINIDVRQIFNPRIPDADKFISTIRHWTVVTPNTGIQSFTISGIPLSADPNYYIVSIEGLVITPDNYTIDVTGTKIDFNQILPVGEPVNVTYIPGIQPPTYWTETFNYQTTEFALTGSLNQQNYIPDPNSEFLVNIGGILQTPNVYSFDVDNQKLIFNDFLPTDIPISVTQTTISENSVPVSIGLTPAHLSIDKNYNVWVSLFNSVSVLKFDSNFNFLFPALPSLTSIPNPGSLTTVAKNFNHLIETDGDFFFKPPITETDKHNNCWVTYAHPLCSLLIKYSESGAQLLQVPLEQYSIPVSLSIDVHNNVWVSNSFGSSYNLPPVSGCLQLYHNTTGELLSSIYNIPRPGYTALDKNGNLWFTYSLRKLGYLNTTTNELSTWTLTREGNLLQNTSTNIDYGIGLESTFNVLDYREDEEFGGMSIDAYNRVWIIDSITNFAYIFSANLDITSIPSVRKIKIIPDATTGYYIDLNTNKTYTEENTNYNYRSAQATGDWTGYRWYQKYANPVAVSTLGIAGSSNAFSITPFVNKHQIRRINETFNTAEHYKTLALPENLYNNSVLFDQFLPATVGTGYLSANEDHGQIVYEKIANFVNNHSDIDTCNISQLLSIAEQVAVPALDYAAIYPSDIKNMLDIASIPKSRLWGVKDQVPVLAQSFGEQYNTQTDLLVAGTSILLRNRFDSSLSLLQVPPLETGETTYSCSQLKGFGLIEPVVSNYIFYRFVPSYLNEYVENIIDWSSPFTTQTPTASTLEEWYGANGALETAFRYLLTKNLFPK